MKDFFAGFGFVLEGLRLIRRPVLRRFVLVPLAIDLLVFGGLLGVAWHFFAQLMDRLMGQLPDWLHWLQYVLWPLFAVSAGLVIFYTFTITANLIAAPFNGLLAEAVEKHLTGQPPPQASWGRILRELGPALFAEVKKILYYLLRALPLALLFVVPGINLGAPALWTLFNGWMLSLEYLDYPMANHHLLFPEPNRRLKNRRLLGIGFGLGCLLLTLVPLLNFVAMPASVAGATALWVRRLRPAAAPPA
ncbi:MAG: sulfate transporter CysZ [Gammaproteobacteria bacterium]|nr:MAG: sulfate transporter CysZ [Gammaproteobacteria bacterium]